MRIARIGRVLLAALSLALGTIADAQTYPSKPIRLVVPYPPGGPLDIAARVLAEGMRPALGSVVVENRAGAGGNIGADLVAKSVPDGYTLLIGAVATHAINPSLYAKMPYDAQKDFAPVTLIANVPNVLVLNADFAAKNNIATVNDFIAHLKANPGKLSFSSGSSGSAGHLAGELFKMRTQTFAVHIPYKGAAPAQMALLAGDVQFMFDNLASAAPRIREGKLRALGVTTAAKSNALPDVPPLAANAQLKGFDISTWFGLFAPAGVPQPILTQIHAAALAAMKTQQFTDTMTKLAAEAAPTSPDEFARLIADDARKYAQIVRVSGAKVD
jgi:tripartite-type tricarboxylate transporter receptor subunit TctC